MPMYIEVKANVLYPVGKKALDVEEPIKELAIDFKLKVAELAEVLIIAMYHYPTLISPFIVDVDPLSLLY